MLCLTPSVHNTAYVYYVTKHGKKDAVKGYSVLETIRREESMPKMGGRVPIMEEETAIISFTFPTTLLQGKH